MKCAELLIIHVSGLFDRFFLFKTNNLMKPTRFFYHYYKKYNCMSVHFKKQCIRVNDVRIEVPTETKWNKTQPNLVVRGFANEVEISITANGQTIAIIK
jgi:hypothetical protein